ncbi:MAG: Dam family site-specific DNA-(adenine-N6)-methyltransferase, partial [Planctomycetaceae bacterium]|nr:Dam family site-specific DNA-(adenine-N6)-methyltransferase [Planctomycetaceae bacterium]
MYNHNQYHNHFEHISVFAPVRPFIKWVGGKNQLLPEIHKVYPEGLGSTYTKYAEPFVGGGAVLFDILNRYDLQEIYISDINRELMLSYQIIRDNVKKLIPLLQTLQDQFIPLDTDNRKEFYYKKRKQFNSLKQSNKTLTEQIETAALFIFLNKTCFNGLYRVNQNGQHNVPMGSGNAPTICDADNLTAVSARLQNVCIISGDYQLAEWFIDEKTFVYFDPPYRPLTATAAFTTYSEVPFDDAEQKRLADFVTKMSRRGAKVVVSNSDPKNADENDNFFDKLYIGSRIK